MDLILDISSKTLLDCLQYRPYLIKPNNEELAHYYGKDDLNDDEIIYFGHDLLNKGAQRVLISLGEDGAIYMDESHLLRVTSPKGKVINARSEEHTSELQSRFDLGCRLLLEKK